MRAPRRGPTTRATLAELLAAVDAVSPLRLAAEWDRTGVLVGDGADAIDRVLLTIDLTDAVIDEARAPGQAAERRSVAARAHRGQRRAADHEGAATAVVAYHPPIFEPLANLRADEPRARIALRAARELAGVVSPHTALDAVAGGVNDWLAEGVGAGALAPIEAALVLPAGEAFLVCTKLPRDAFVRVGEAMSMVGAGRIGRYSRCAFEIEGHGTFEGDASTSPRVGRRERFERVEESKLEMVSSKAALPSVLAALRAAHPYEAPPIEVIALAARPGIREGHGRVLELLRPVNTAEIASRLARHLRLRRGSIEVVERASGASGAASARSVGAGDRASRGDRHQRIGLCPGSGGSLVSRAVEMGCTLFVTGEMKHHERLEAQSRGCSLLLAGHTETERGFLPRYRAMLAKLLPAVPIALSRRDRPPASRRI